MSTCLLRAPSSRAVQALSTATLIAGLLTACGTALVQTPAPTVAPAKNAVAAPTIVANPGPVDASAIASLAWLRGCWAGSVNQRDFREQWLPLDGDMLVGVGHTVNQGKTQSYELLRIEARGDGVYYVAKPSGQIEAAFKLQSIETDGKDAIFVFSNPTHDFPQRIIYRRGGEGWLYAMIEGKLNGQDRKTIFPMRHVDCQNGEFILN